MIVFDDNFQSNFAFVKFDKYNKNVKSYKALIRVFSKSFIIFSDVNQFTSSSSIDFYITFLRSNSMSFEIAKLNHFHFIINIQTAKAFLNEGFDSNKKIHIEEFEKVNSL